MTLTLSITNADRLPNGEPTRMELDRHGLTIGRSPHMDWSLPDPDHYISSSHCEIRYRDGAYTLVDTSTNGTFLKGSSERLPGPHTLADGEVLQVGGFEIAVRLRDGAGSGPALTQPGPGGGGAPPGGGQAFNWGAPPSPPAPAPSAWDRQDGGGWASPPPAAPGGGWGAPPPPSSGAGWSASEPAGAPPPASNGGWAAPPPPPPSAAWDAPKAAPAPQAWGTPEARPSAAAPAASWGAPASDGSAHAAWDAPKPEAEPASAWSDPAGAEARAAGAADIWASLSNVNAVDWDRGFGGRGAPAAPSGPAPEWSAQAWSAPAARPAGSAAQPPAPPAPPPAPPPGGGEWPAFAAAAGIAPGQVKTPPVEALGAAGRVLHRLVGGLVVLLEARARAKSQMGAQATLLEVGGNNPLKFARSPDLALAQLLNAPERGFMDADRAVEDAFRDLQAHQMATLAAMQGALKATVNRFSPAAIRSRAERRGLLAKILPAARDQAMWQAYEREFEGVAKGSDEAFMDVFAGEFRRAYEEAAAQLKSRGP